LTRLEQALGALVFACHPVKAQNVAWISGSTDVPLTKEPGIVLPAILLALDLWVVAPPSDGGRCRWRLVPCSLFGAVALGYLGLTVLELPAWRDELTWTARTMESDPTGRSGRVGSLAPLALHPIYS
jgi:hypothetical protein